jgi:tRNA 2-thiouridine synthesizing protein A
MGCGQLVFELRSRVNRLQPGSRLEIVARDPGAPLDLPAWCRMTGHELVSADHPVYVIQRKPD